MTNLLILAVTLRHFLIQIIDLANEDCFVHTYLFGGIGMDSNYAGFDLSTWLERCNYCIFNLSTLITGFDDCTALIYTYQGEVKRQLSPLRVMLLDCINIHQNVLTRVLARPR